MKPTATTPPNGVDPKLWQEVSTRPRRPRIDIHALPEEAEPGDDLKEMQAEVLRLRNINQGLTSRNQELERDLATAKSEIENLEKGIRSLQSGSNSKKNGTKEAKTESPAAVVPPGPTATKAPETTPTTTITTAKPAASDDEEGTARPPPKE